MTNGISVRRLLILWITMLGGVGCASPTPERSTVSPQGGVADSGQHPAPSPTTIASDSTSVDAAVAVLREYYDAIEARDFRRAFMLWEGEGAASGKAYEDFAAGFANTASVAFTPGDPGAIEGAAGSRFVEIPVEIRAVTRLGEQQRYGGTYVLRRSVVDGAADAQRRWHLYSAKIARDGASSGR